MKITLVYSSSLAAELAWEEQFSEPDETGQTLVTLHRKRAEIEIEKTGNEEIHLTPNDCLIAIVI
jgi:hypothetical protein